MDEFLIGYQWGSYSWEMMPLGYFKKGDTIIFPLDIEFPVILRWLPADTKISAFMWINAPAMVVDTQKSKGLDTQKSKGLAKSKGISENTSVGW